MSSPRLPSGSPIDHDHLTDMSQGDVVFEAELMQEFLRATPDLLARLESAIECDDRKTAEMVSHTLKGSCRSLGARPMSDPCEALEAIARSGDLSQAGDLCAEIHAHYDALRAYIARTWDVKAA